MENDNLNQKDKFLDLSEKNKRAIMQNFTLINSRFDKYENEITHLNKTISKLQSEIENLRQTVIMATLSNRGSGATSN